MVREMAGGGWFGGLGGSWFGGLGEVVQGVGEVRLVRVVRGVARCIGPAMVGRPSGQAEGWFAVPERDLPCRRP